MNSKEIRKQKQSLRRLETLTKEQELELEELSLRSMIMSCLVYGEDIFNRHYAEEYINILGYDRVMEIYNDQKKYFDTKCRVEKNVYTDCEGVTYNRLVEEEC